jgi:hypothetical protein
MKLDRAVGADVSAFRGIPVIPPLLFHSINLDQKIECRQEPIGGITKQPLMTGVVAEKSLTLLCRHGN